MVKFHLDLDSTSKWVGYTLTTGIQSDNLGLQTSFRQRPTPALIRS